MRTRRWLFKTHLYVGTLAAAPLIVIVLTGVILGFYDPLRYAEPPYRLEAPAVYALSPAALIERFHSSRPDAAPNVLYLPTAPERAARLEFRLAGQRAIALIDPNTGQTLALQDADHRDWLQYLYELHRGKPFGLEGQVVASATGGFVALLWLVGLGLRWTRRTKASTGRRCDRRIRFLNVHRWTGVWVGAIPVLLAVLGAVLNFAGPLGNAFNPPPQVTTPAERAQLPLNNVVALAMRAYPAAPPERVYFPQHTALWQIRFRDGGRVFLAGDSGRILKVNAPLAHWTSLLYPLHSGRIFGAWGPMAMALVGIVLLTMSVSGLVYWWRASATPPGAPRVKDPGSEI